MITCSFLSGCILLGPGELRAAIVPFVLSAALLGWHLKLRRDAKRASPPTATATATATATTTVPSSAPLPPEQAPSPVPSPVPLPPEQAPSPPSAAASPDGSLSG